MFCQQQSTRSEILIFILIFNVYFEQNSDGLDIGLGLKMIKIVILNNKKKEKRSKFNIKI